MNQIKTIGRFLEDWTPSAKLSLSILLFYAVFIACAQWSAAQGTRLEETGLKTTLTLEQAVENALTQNPSLQAVMQSTAFTEGEAESAQERPNPTFAAGIETSGGTGTRYRDFLISLEQQWETAGKRKYRTLVAKDHEERAHYEIENARRLLIEEVKLAYLEVARVQNLQTLCQGFAAFLEEFLQFNELLMQEGEVPPINVQMVRLESDKFANEQLRYQVRLRLSKIRLAQLMGMPLDFPFAVDSNPFKISLDLSDPQELLTHSLQHRPDLKFLASELKGAELQLSLEVARSKPNVILGADVHKQREEFGHDVRGSFTAIGFYVRIPIPVFDRNHGAIIRATATQSSLRQQLAAARKNIQKEVLAQVENFSFATQVLKLNSERIVRAQETAGALAEAYVLGATAVTDVLGLQRAVYELKQEFALAEFERNSAWVRLQASIGENSVEDLVNVNGQVTQ